MKLLKTTALIAALCAPTLTFADDFGVELEWNTMDAKLVMDTFPQQKLAFGALIDKGEIKDMFIVPTKIDGKTVQLLRFVIEADDEAHVRQKLKELPMYKKNLIKISNIKQLGSKWLDKTPVYKNYGVIITWKQNKIDPMEISRVLGVDLQLVVNLNHAGLVTSSYINTQKLKNGLTRPIYSVAFLAKDEAHAKMLSQQFEAVSLGYATIEIQYLGHKLDMKRR